MTDAADLYTSESIESGPLSLNEDGLLLFALLVGGDYDTGISNCGPAIAHGLARTGLGRKLRQALTASDASRPFQLAAWREALKLELRTNSSGLLPKRQPKVADTINTDFPNPVTVELYMDPLTSWCSRFTGTPPDTDLWIPQEPDVQRVYSLCITHFRWQEVILERLKSKFWPGVALRMMFSRYLLYDRQTNRFATPETNANLLKIVSRHNNSDSGSSVPLNLYRVRISIANFIQKTGLQRSGENDYILITVPQLILSVATRDSSLRTTNVFETPLDVKANKENTPSSSSTQGAGSRRVDVDLTEVEDLELQVAHRNLSRQGLVHLT
ncbi:hypothetical protein C8R47DRAFT_1228159 [Mycena vitilis]|nr:hypothetical protein C8R47DRAFT_1228159 [Mycena vitilis]